MNKKIICTKISEFIEKTNFDTEEFIECFEGSAKLLDNAISSNEIIRAIAKLKNGKAAGHDRVTAEIVKDCAKMLAPKYEELFNKVFKFHEEPIDKNKGLIIPIPKPYEPKTIESIRPITILTTKKILSPIILGRIRKKIDEILPPSQLAYNVYTLKALQSQWEDFKRNYFVLSVDILKAFDTGSREKCLEILKDHLDEDKHRMVRYHIASAKTCVKIGTLRENTKN